MKRMLLALAFTGMACTGADETTSTGEQEAQVHQEALDPISPESFRPSLRALSAPGLCSDLELVLGQPPNFGARLNGAVECTYGADGSDVENVSLWGHVSVGYVHAIAEPPTVEVNGRTVGAMNVQLQGAAARYLFESMNGNWSLHLPDNIKVGPTNRVRCERNPDDSHFCELKGFVGFETP